MSAKYTKGYKVFLSGSIFLVSGFAMVLEKLASIARLTASWLMKKKESLQ